jgi:hypothetical protein
LKLLGLGQPHDLPCFRPVKNNKYVTPSPSSLRSHSPRALFSQDASVHLNLSLRLSTLTEEDYVNVSVLFYHQKETGKEGGAEAGTEGGVDYVPDSDLCALEFPPGASDRAMHTVMAHKVEAAPGEGPASTEWAARVEADYKVVESGVQNVLFQICPPLVSVSEVGLAGELSFRNPYGFLPGRFYGYLPFEGARFFAFLVFFLVYLGLVCKHRGHLLRLHYAILSVLVIATAESLSWFLAFSHMNTRGTPYCCPFPAVVVSAMVFELVQKTVSRALLLLICLGYGIARPSLHKGEWLSLLTLSLLYLGATMLDEASEIAEARQLGGSGGGGGGGGASTNRLLWSFPALLCDIVFLSWIYMSLVTMMKILREQNETYKLELYSRLSNTILAFVSLFGILTLVVSLSRVGVFTWPWTLLWIETVAWEVLNFAVLTAVCFLWRPTPTSQFLAQAKQLPTTEGGRRGGRGEEGGIEFSMGSFSITDEGEEEEEEEEEEGEGIGGGMDLRVDGREGRFT